MTTIPPLTNAETTDEYTAKKDNVVTVADSNITLTGEQTINGVACVENDRILLTGQTDASENGIWLVGSGVYGAWSRPTDFAAGGEAAGTWTHITQGTDYDESVWFCVTNRTCTIDTDDQEWRNVNEDPVSGFDISTLTEDSTNSSTDYIAKSDGTDMEKINRNDFLLPGVSELTDEATVTINLANPERIFTVELGGNRTLAVTNATVGDRFAVRLEQDGTGSRTVTWWDTINWPGASAPTLTTTADRADYFDFACTATNTFDNILQAQNLTSSVGSSVDLTSNIIAAWDLEEASGTRVDSANSYDLTPSASDPGNAAGKDGNAADFTSANSQYLRLAVNAASEFNFEDSDFTIAIWINPDNLSGSPAYFYMDSVTIIDNGAAKPSFAVTGAGAVTHSSDITTSTWANLLVCTHDSVNDLVKMSLNGGAYETSAASGGANALGDGYLHIGSSNTPGDYYDGKIDSVTVWGKALSQAEVTELYNSGTGKFYPFT